MGQQISDVGDRNLDTLREHGARAVVAESDYRYLSSRVEKLIKLAQSGFSTRVNDWCQSAQSPNVQQQLLQDSGRVSSSSEPAACNVLPLQFANISEVDISHDTYDYDVDVLPEPVAVYCHVPVRKIRRVDTCNVGCQSDYESHRIVSDVHNIPEHLLAETTSFVHSEVSVAANDKVNGIRNDVAESEASDKIFRSGIERVDDAERRCRSRPPQSPKSVATAGQMAQETRPSEIGSYLTVAPLVSSSDLGLSPIDETAEVMTSTALLSHACDSDVNCTFKQSTIKSSNHTVSSNAESSTSHQARLQPSVYIVYNSEVPHPKNPAATLINSCFDVSTCNPFRMEKMLLPSDEVFETAESSINAHVSRAKNYTLTDRKFPEDACPVPVNSFSTAVKGETDDIDKSPVARATNDIRVATSVAEGLPDEDVMKVNERVGSSSVEVTSSDCPTNQCQLLQSNSVREETCPVFSPSDVSFRSLQTSTPDLSKKNDLLLNKSEDHCTPPEMDASVALHDIASRSDAHASACDVVSTKRQMDSLCLDWSSNNNDSNSPVPLVVRRQVRHLSEGAGASVSAAGQHTSGGQSWPPVAKSSSQLSLDDVIVCPRTVPEHLDFQQLEKFEGKYFWLLDTI